MLLLAGVVIQMTLGENGLFAKATNSKKEQSKSELYETAKIEYLNLKTKAIEEGRQDPPISEVLSTTNFLSKYNVDGGNITDKKGEVIDTRDNLLDKLDGMSSSDVPITPSAQTYPTQSYPKTVDGVTIQEQDKDKLILKIKIKEQTKLAIRPNTYIPNPYNIQVEWGNWGYNSFKPEYNQQSEHEYYPGEFIMKITGAKSFSLESTEWRYDKFEVTVLHWGKFEDDSNEQNNIRLYSVKDIKMPEPNNVTVEYNQATIANIPEDLFKYKPTRKNMSCFQSCSNITSVPSNLYKYNTGMTTLNNAFINCYSITNIPEGLFKYNQNLTSIYGLFSNSQITTIPENLFKFNKELITVSNLFGNSRITNIPENLFSNNKKVTNFNQAFMYNPKLKEIPENIFKNNTKATDFSGTFQGCSLITTIPGNLFDNNPDAKRFDNTFSSCSKLNNIPWNLFGNNNKADEFRGTFSGPNELYYLSLPNRLYSLQESQYRGIFAGCTNASNYSSIPDSWKSW